MLYFYLLLYYYKIDYKKADVAKLVDVLDLESNDKYHESSILSICNRQKLNP